MSNSSQISNLRAIDAWKLIDKVLLGIRTSEISEEMHTKIAKLNAVAHAEGVRKRNGAYYPHRRIVLEEEAADEWAEKLYNAALRVWQIQGYKPSLPFARAVYGHLLAPFFAARRGAVTSDMQRTELRTRTPGSTQAHRSEFVRATLRLESRWSRRMEAAGREFEYAAQCEERTLLNKSCALVRNAFCTSMAIGKSPVACRRCPSIEIRRANPSPRIRRNRHRSGPSSIELSDRYYLVCGRLIGRGRKSHRSYVNASRCHIPKLVLEASARRDLNWHWTIAADMDAHDERR